MKWVSLFCLLAGVCLTGCGEGQEKAPTQALNTNVVLRLSVLQSGKLFADNAEVRLDVLDTRLSEIKSQNGVVWYYREGGQVEPPPVAMEVMKLIVKHRVPVSMSSKADFSDIIDGHGSSRPKI